MQIKIQTQTQTQIQTQTQTQTQTPVHNHKLAKYRLFLSLPNFLGGSFMGLTSDKQTR